CRATPRLSRAGTDELVALLAHPNGWHRDTAHRLLFERQAPAAIDPLRKLLRTGNDPRPRLHALHVLEGLSGLEDDDLEAGLMDESPEVREHAIRLAEPRLASAPALRAQVVRLAEDPAVRVRFQAALTLGAIDPSESAPALATIARRDAGDPWM